jgi:hypothetical protein
VKKQFAISAALVSAWYNSTSIRMSLVTQEHEARELQEAKGGVSL